ACPSSELSPRAAPRPHWRATSHRGRGTANTPMRLSLSNSRPVAEGLLVFCCVLWALAFLWTKDALSAADPMTFLALRFATGAVILAAIARRSLLEPTALRGGLLLGSVLFVGYALQTAGLVHTTPARSGFITGMCV